MGLVHKGKHTLFFKLESPKHLMLVSGIHGKKKTKNKTKKPLVLAVLQFVHKHGELINQGDSQAPPPKLWIL